MRKHNFISKEYVDTVEKRERQIYIPLILIFIAINLLIFEYLNYKKEELDQFKSKSVVGYKETNSEPQKSNLLNIFDLRKKIQSYLDEDVRVVNFSGEGNKINIFIAARNKQQCISFLKNIEESGEFNIVKISPIQVIEKDYRLSLDLLWKRGIAN